MLKKMATELISLCAIAILTMLLTISCNSSSSQLPDKTTAPVSDCRDIQHKLGTICVPTEPQRVVALDPRYVVDPMLSLGVQPVGIAIYDAQGQEVLPGLSSEDFEAVTRVGDTYSPSLEKILELKPDLILAVEFAHEAIYEQLSEIAPTVLLQYNLDTFEGYPSFKENLRRIAKIFDRKAEAETILDQYQSRVKELRQQLGREPEDIGYFITTLQWRIRYTSSRTHLS